MGMAKEFREFAMRGNVVDLAIGVIIGTAFGTIVSSLVNDVVMPPIGRLTGGIDFKDLFYALDGKTYLSLADAKAKAAPVIAYGQFLNTVINFLIIALVIFLIVKQMNRMRKPEVPAVTTKDCPFCTTAIPLKASRCPNCTSQLMAGASAD